MRLGFGQLKELLLKEQNETSTGGIGVDDVTVLPIDRWVDAAEKAAMNPLVAMLIRRAAEVGGL